MLSSSGGEGTNTWWIFVGKKAEEQLAKRRGLTSEEEFAGDDVGSGFAQGQVSSADIQKYANMVINGTTEEIKLEGAQNFRKILSSEKHPPIDEVIRQGVLPHLVAFLSIDTAPKLQFEAAWSLTNVASGTSQNTQAVIKAGALDPVISIVQPTAKLSVLRNAVWTLSNLCRGKPAPDFRVVGKALPILAAVIHSNDQDVLTDALWALSYLSDGTNDRVAAVLEAGVLQRVVELLSFKSQSVITPALRTVGNIVTGDDLQTQAVLNAGALPHLLGLMQYSKKVIKKEAVWTLSNVMAGTQPQIQAVLDANCMQVLVQLLQGAESDVRREATWAVCNGTSCGTADQIAYMVQCGVVPPLAQQLAAYDMKLAGVVLEGLENILKAGIKDSSNPAYDNPYVRVMEEAKVPETLLEMDSRNTDLPAEVYNRLQTLLSTYFDLDEEEPGEVGQGFGGDGFGPQTWAPGTAAPDTAPTLPGGAWGAPGGAAPGAGGFGGFTGFNGTFQ